MNVRLVGTEGWDFTVPPCHEPGSMHITLGNTKGELTALERPQHRVAGEAGRIGAEITANSGHS